MKVKRVYEKEVKQFKVGDQVRIGKYTATAVRDEGNKMMWLLDQCLDKTYTREGDFLKKLNDDLMKDKNFEFARKYAYVIDGDLFRIPYAGEMFSGTCEEEWVRKFYEPDVPNGEFYPILDCMKDRKNRVAERKGDPYAWWWLMNKVKEEYSSATFAHVAGNGVAYYGNSSTTVIGVRPAFFTVSRCDEI